MIYADDIRRTILIIAEELGPDHTFDPSDIAMKIDKENWPGLMPQVTIVADALSKEGKITAEMFNGAFRYKKN
jgi:hypothetical protein